MAIGYAGGNNTFVPTLELSGNLQVSFSRNVKQFAINRYVTIVPVKKPYGSYLRFNPLDLGRVPNVPYGPNWAPGTLRPTGFHNLQGFEEFQFLTKRKSFSSTLDSRSVDIASWDVKKSHSEMLAQQAMAYRAYMVCTEATTSGNYDSTHVKTATQLGGGFLSGGTTADPRILATFNEATNIIQKDSMGRVRPGEVSALMNAKTAKALSQTRELREYVMQQPDALKNIRMDSSNYNSAYGLPSVLYTCPIIVEDTFYTANNRGATGDTGSPAFPDNTILMFVRPGGLESAEGAAGYSTLSVFMFEDMSVEEWPDARNRLVSLDITDEFDQKVSAPVTGVLVTNVFS